MHAIASIGIWYSFGWIVMIFFSVLMMVAIVSSEKLMTAFSRKYERKPSGEDMLKKYASGEMLTYDERHG